MGIIEDKKKFKPTKKQKNPVNQIGNRNIKTNTFDIDKKTIKKQQNKT